ncbi:MAG: hypothetical protein P8L44_02505 [Opitutales bacterium]|nr:hypothetical protein [Opitutales bacterium]
MTRNFAHIIFSFLLLSGFVALSGSSHSSNKLGIFSNWSEVGDTGQSGGAFFNSAEEAYYLRGAGHNIWSNKDGFGFLWKEVSGDITMEGSVTIIHLSKAPHRKAGWMIRSSLDPNAAHVTCALHGDGLIALQYRPAKGAETKGIPFQMKFADSLRLEKRGKLYTMTAIKDKQLIETKSVSLEGFEGPLLAGPWVCSKDVEQLEAARFGNVRFYDKDSK